MVFTDSAPHASERLEEEIAKFVTRDERIAPEHLKDWGDSRIEKEALYRLLCYACETDSMYSRKDITKFLDYLDGSCAWFPEVPTKAVLRLHCLAKLVWFDCNSSGELQLPTSEFIDRKPWSHAVTVPPGAERRSDSAESNKTKIMTAFKDYQERYETRLIPFRWLESLESVQNQSRSATGFVELDIMDDVMRDIVKNDIRDTKIELVESTDYRVEMMRAFDADWLAA